MTGDLGPQFKWWVPKDAKVLFDRKELRKNGTLVHAILTEEQSRIILYLEWYTS